ncbi:MAG: hypothetical protein KDB80_08475 [Planctomycetes bacterium]|nr:hypothetical protein [Planctomycetota bacterium]
MSVRAFLGLIVVVGGIATCLLLWSDNRRLRLGRAAHAERVAADAAELERTIERLELELHQAIETRQSLLGTIDEKIAELDELRAERQERLRRATKAPPEGVRLALLAIQRRLEADGYDGLRFLSAARIEDRELREVEATEYRRDWFSTAVYSVDRASFELDRATSTLTIRCREGKVIANDVERELGENGETIVLTSVDGRAWEAELPYLLVARGAYPEDVEPEQVLPSIDDATARIWVERLNLLLDQAETDLHYRVARVRDLRDARFVDVLMHGYDEHKQLAASGKSSTCEVRVDPSADTAELVLRDGTWRSRTGKTPIEESGMRILLHGVDAASARATMLGMVTEGS